MWIKIYLVENLAWLDLMTLLSKTCGADDNALGQHASKLCKLYSRECNVVIVISPGHVTPTTATPNKVAFKVLIKKHTAPCMSYPTHRTPTTRKHNWNEEALFPTNDSIVPSGRPLIYLTFRVVSLFAVNLTSSVIFCCNYHKSVSCILMLVH